jgi:hypothetical protein
MKSKLKLLLVLTVVLAFLAPTVEALAGGKDDKSSGGSVNVKGYHRKDGTYVQPHSRTRPDGNPYNNYSFPGNYNPNTGRTTPGNPDKYLERYYERKSSPWSLPRTGTDD